jgi:predicted nucleic acid-binding protein
LLINLPKAATLMPVVPEVWTYERDPDDAHYVNLALASHSRLIVSRDKDLLDLMAGVTSESIALLRHHPDFSVLTPNDFLTEVARASGT